MRSRGWPRPPSSRTSSNELTSLAAPLLGWKDELTAEAKRVAEALDLIGRGKRIWSETREAARDRCRGRGGGAPRRELDPRAERGGGEPAHLGGASPGRERPCHHPPRRGRCDSGAAAGGDPHGAREPLVPQIARRSGRVASASEIRSELPRVPAELLAYAESSAAYLAARSASARRAGVARRALDVRPRSLLLSRAASAWPARRERRGQRGCSSARTRSDCCSPSSPPRSFTHWRRGA